MSDSPEHSPALAQLYRTMYLIRRFEETVLEEFSRGAFYGTTHTYLGQEANAAGVLACIQENDVVVSNHRCHGHFLAYGGDPQALFAEMMGKPGGLCGGRGGSQHIHWRNFYSNGILGGTIPVSVGTALAEKWKGSGAVTVAFLGDGALGQGVVYEALNFASLWLAPILFVLENNHIAQTTPVELAAAGSFAGRFAAFGIPSVELDTSDVEEILPAAADNLRLVRAEQRPRALIINTARFGPHSKGDDTRTAEAVERLRRERDPLAAAGTRLDAATRKAVEAEINTLVAEAFRKALAEPAGLEGEPAEAQA